jgi:hypothetical protein
MKYRWKREDRCLASERAEENREGDYRVEDAYRRGVYQALEWASRHAVEDVLLRAVRLAYRYRTDERDARHDQLLREIEWTLDGRPKQDVRGLASSLKE